MKNIVVLVPHLAWNLDLPLLRLSRKKCPALSHFCPVLSHFFNGTFLEWDKTGRCPPPPFLLNRGKGQPHTHKFLIFLPNGNGDRWPLMGIDGHCWGSALKQLKVELL